MNRHNLILHYDSFVCVHRIYLLNSATDVQKYPILYENILSGNSNNDLYREGPCVRPLISLF